MRIPFLFYNLECLRSLLGISQHLLIELPERSEMFGKELRKEMGVCDNVLWSPGIKDMRSSLAKIRSLPLSFES